MQVILSKQVKDFLEHPSSNIPTLRVFRRGNCYSFSKPNRLESAIHWFACLLRFEKEIKTAAQINKKPELDQSSINLCQKIKDKFSNKQVKSICEQLVNFIPSIEKDFIDAGYSASFLENKLFTLYLVKTPSEELLDLTNNATLMLESIKRDAFSMMYIGPDLYTPDFFIEVLNLTPETSPSASFSLDKNPFEILCANDSHNFSSLDNVFKESYVVALKILDRYQISEISNFINHIPGLMGNKEFIEECLKLPKFKRKPSSLRELIQAPLANNKEFMANVFNEI